MAVSSSGSRSGRMSTREISPERTKVWTTEPTLIKSHPKLPVVYYLSRNGQLEHPHFMEVPLSSPNGLFLTDVINRLEVLRGKGMASMYSWSCKRSYKNGFVWHDLSENDFIYPAHGHEYVLKGSQLPESKFPDSVEVEEQPPPPPEDRRRRNQSCSSIDFNNLHEYNHYSVYKPETCNRSIASAAAADASTQTEDIRRRRRRPPTEIVEENKSQEQSRDEIEMLISPPPSDSSPETLETLMKTDGRLVLRHENSIEDRTLRSGGKSSVLMQLISCGSVSFKDCGPGQGVGLMSQYKLRLPRGGGSGGSGRVKLEEKEYFSGSLVETKKEEFPSLKRSTSYNADRSSKLELQSKEIEGVRSKCIPRKPKTHSSTRKEGITDISSTSTSTSNTCT
ncbi:hypothetical protein ACJIZ3_012587 [Penstemon smallii]|uniref:SOSEKI DIX-like domain-containing protein n=1 Tax=Penstemon smallii TaxID=265156 RepID=A0ABD3UR07_9LAMI